MNRIGLTGLVKIELPERTIRFCDGGVFEYQGEKYSSRDAVFGTIGGIAAMSEGVGDTIAALQMTLLPPSTSAAAEISKPSHQTARVTFYVAEFNPDTHVITSATVEAVGQIDQTKLTIGKGKKILDTLVVSLIERVFEQNIGNSLNPNFHKSIWPGETGHDQATGLSVPVAWGVEKPRSGGAYSGGGGGGGIRLRDSFRAY